MMDQTSAPARQRLRPVLTPASIAKLPRHIVLRHDKARGRWVILAPERVLVPDDTAVVVLQHLDGIRSIADIAGDLAQIYHAPADQIGADILTLLQNLADKGFLTAIEPAHG